MQGTPKQIVWAEKIKKERMSVIVQLRNLATHAKEHSTEGSKNNLIFAQIITALDAVASNDDASFWINHGRTMVHDIEEQHMLLAQLSDASVLADPKAKLIKTYQTLKQHGYL